MILYKIFWAGWNKYLDLRCSALSASPAPWTHWTSRAGRSFVPSSIRLYIPLGARQRQSVIPAFVDDLLVFCLFNFFFFPFLCFCDGWAGYVLKCFSLFGFSKVFIVNISNFVGVRGRFLRKIVDCFGFQCLQGLSGEIIREELPSPGSTTGEQ